MRNPSRRTVLKSAAALSAAAAFGFNVRRASAAAEFQLKVATDAPGTHAVSTSLQVAADRIKEKSAGRIEISVFHSGQLGSGPQALNQLRTGSLELQALSSVVLGSLVPTAMISGVAFAFTDMGKVWKALDGDLGNHMRSEIKGAGLHVLDKIWDVGFRQITSRDKAINGPDDLKGFHIRVPPAPLWTSLFTALGAAPLTIQMAELYSALQTKVADGQENPAAIIEASKLDEVQKYLAVTNHMWDGVHILANSTIWEGMPAEVRELISTTFDDTSISERKLIVEQEAGAKATLASRGMTIVEPSKDAFRAKLQEAGFYTNWKGKFPETAWSLLQKYAGELA